MLKTLVHNQKRDQKLIQIERMMFLLMCDKKTN